MFTQNLFNFAGSLTATEANSGETKETRERLITCGRRNAGPPIQLFRARVTGKDSSRKWLKSPPWILLMASLLTACGDTHVEWPTINHPDFQWPPWNEPIEVVSMGPIAALPKAIVNGVTYDTTAANVTINGKTGALTDLQIGHIVTVNGRLSMGRATGFADRVEFEANVVGPVESIDTSLRRIMVMGQSVLLDANTAFDSSIDPLLLSGLSVGAVVQISGYSTAGGEIVATRIESAPANSGFQVSGAVAGLDIGSLGFHINGLTVDYSSALMINLPDGMPADTMNVVVRGSLATDGRFVAEQLMVSALDENIAAGTSTEISGYISSYRSDTDFDVSGFPVSTDYQTVFYFGMREDLRLGAKVEINGQRTARGAIIADQIGFGSLATTLTYNFKDFTQVRVTGLFNVTLQQGGEFSVSVNADAGTVPHLDVRQAGPAIHIGLQGNVQYIDTLNAVITLPVLNQVRVSELANVTLKGFDQPGLSVEVSGLSSLTGMELVLDSLSGNISGVSRMDFTDSVSLNQVDVEVNGISTALFNMTDGALLTGSVSGESLLSYIGTNVVENVTTDITSTLTRLGF